MGMSLTATLSPDAHLIWTKSQIMQICRALGRAPLPPSHIKQRHLLYGAHSKISHTHCLMALSPQAIREVDSLLEGISKQIGNLPLTFPKAGATRPPRGHRPQHPLNLGGLRRGGDPLLDADPQR